MFNSARRIIFTGILGAAAFAQDVPHLPPEDAARIHEFYRLADQIQDQIWPDWSRVPSPLLLVTPETEFLTHWNTPPKDFEKVSDDLYARPRKFPTTLLATFPAFGPPSVIVIGEPQNTGAKKSTPWLITVMHEHFHQLQNSQRGYFQAVDALGLTHGDNTGMWMIKYPFPYEDPLVAKNFGHLRDMLLAAVGESDPKRFRKLAAEYVTARKKFMSELSAEDHKYLSFQL